MLVCFGSAWPFSIWKSYVSKKTSGKSLPFLWIIFTGYLCGIAYKIAGKTDKIIYLYAFNALLVFSDIILFYRNRKSEKSKAA